MEFTDFFSGIIDPRVEGRTTHLLGDILLLSLCAVICGADDFEDIENYGKEKESFLKGFMPLSGGIPSHDTIDRVFRMICPKELGSCLFRHSRGILEFLGRHHIGIDGKVLRATATSGHKKSGLCIVSAWASEQGVCLGQLRMDGKSNEKTAIPALLADLDLKQAIVSIDAIACTQSIAATIINKGGDYILALKGNQKNLYQEAQDEFERQKPGLKPDMWEDFGSGRIERRMAWQLIAPIKGKQSIKSCRKIAGWNNNFLLDILKSIEI